MDEGKAAEKKLEVEEFWQMYLDAMNVIGNEDKDQCEWSLASLDFE